MKKITKILSLVLIATLMMTAVRIENTDVRAAKKKDAEIEKAISLGLVPKALQRDYGKTITLSEYASMFDQVIKKATPGRLKEWQKKSKRFRRAKAKMTRNFGAQALLTAAIATGADDIGYERCCNWIWDAAPKNKDWWAGLDYSKKYFPDGEKKYYNKVLIGTNWEFLNTQSMISVAGYYAVRYCYENAETFMDHNKKYLMNWKSALKRSDAIRTAYRFYENAICVDFIPLNKDVCGVTDKSISLAQSMPVATYDKLPAWRGYNLANCVDFGDCSLHLFAHEDDIKRVVGQGMNFVRVPLNVQDLYKQEGNKEWISRGCVIGIDNIVNICAKYGVHVCFDVHNSPGFNTGLGLECTIFSNRKEQKIFCDFWKWMAEHFKNVPSNLLSFNLMNEPHILDGDLNEGVYAEIMMEAIRGIREITEDRLIVVDMMNNYSNPVQALKSSKVVQSFHPYILKVGDKEWPAISTIRFINRMDAGNLSISGNFPAGTEISVVFHAAQRTSTLSWKSGNNVISSEKIGGEKIGENGCVEIKEKGTEGEFRMYQNREWKTVLKEPAKKLDLIQTGEGVWYLFTCITIKTPSYTRVIRGSFETDDPIAPKILIDDEGNVTGEEPGMVRTDNAEYIRELFKDIVDFSKESGEAIMAQELGTDPTVPNKATLAFEDDLLTVLNDYGIPWAHWNGNFGLWVTYRQLLFAKLYDREDWDFRPGAKYTDLGDGWYFDEGLAEVLKKH